MHAAPAIDEQQLPPQLRRLVRAIGLPATATLLKARGGTRLMIGRRAEGAGLLIELVGKQHAKAVLDAFEGQSEVILPKADKLLAQARDRAIRAEHAQGQSLMALALRYDLTSRHIQNILGEQPRPRDAAQQQELFK